MVRRTSDYDNIVQILKDYKPPVVEPLRFMFELTFSTEHCVNGFVFAGQFNAYLKKVLRNQGVGLQKLFIKPQKIHGGIYKFYIYITMKGDIDGEGFTKELHHHVLKFTDLKALYITPNVNFKKKVEL